MEIFLPSLIILLLAALFSFLVIPRVGSTVLVVVAILALIAAGVHHYSMFSSEYQLSTWQLGLAAYAPFVVLGFALLFILAALFFLFTGKSPKNAAETFATPLKTLQNATEASVAAMPNAASATNSITAALNRGLNNSLGAAAPAPAPAPAPAANRFGGVPLSQI
jgi:hypothetical protein